MSYEFALGIPTDPVSTTGPTTIAPLISGLQMSEILSLFDSALAGDVQSAQGLYNWAMARGASYPYGNEPANTLPFAMQQWQKFELADPALAAQVMGTRPPATNTPIVPITGTQPILPIPPTTPTPTPVPLPPQNPGVPLPPQLPPLVTGGSAPVSSSGGSPGGAPAAPGSPAPLPVPSSSPIPWGGLAIAAGLAYLLAKS